MKAQPCLIVRIWICFRHPLQWRKRLIHGSACKVVRDQCYSYPWDDPRGNELARAFLILEKENAEMWEAAFRSKSKN